MKDVRLVKGCPIDRRWYVYYKGSLTSIGAVAMEGTKSWWGTWGGLHDRGMSGPHKTRRAAIEGLIVDRAKDKERRKGLKYEPVYICKAEE